MVLRKISFCALAALISAASTSAVHSSNQAPDTPCTGVAVESQALPPPQTTNQDTSCLIDAAARFPSEARIVDIRGRAEYSQLHIPNAVNQPVHSLMNAGAGDLIVYDDSRFRSDALQLCERLSRYGVPNFKVIDGGIAAWAQSTRSPHAFDVSRLSDSEASAAITAGNSAIVTLSNGFSTVLRQHRVDVSTANPSSSRRTIVLAEPGTGHDQITSRLGRRSGQNTTFYWTGTPDRLASVIGTHLAQDQRRRQGPMVSPNCPGL